MNSEQLQTIKQTLLEEQDTFIAQIKKHKAEEFDEGELSHYDNHPGDEGSALYDETLRRALTEHDIRHLGDIRHALERMDEGTYHLCEVCGKEINPDRLEALPTTSTCIDHADHVLERKMYHESKEGLVIDDVDALEQLQAFGSSDQLSENKTDHADPIEKVSSKTKHV